MKLFTIGDSVSQGFMSLAAARTDNSYSTLIAKKLNLNLQTADYRFADWNIDGIPLNVETIMRELQSRYGSNIGGLEWLTVAQTINRVVDRAEDYYERGEGRADNPYDKETQYFNNVAVWGFEVADSWQVSGETCQTAIMLSQKKRPTGDDTFTVGADNPMYRTALKVLNPSLKPAFNNLSQLGWLKLHVTGTDDNGKPVTDKGGKKVGGTGVENLVLWLGANNALGTVLSLKINQTPNDPAMRPHMLDHLIRAKSGWNLWHPDDFAADYRVMINKVDAIMEKNANANWKVFIGTVPLVTIAPIAKGIGETTNVPVVKNVGGGDVVSNDIYYKYYTYFPFEEKFAIERQRYLTMQDALHIDNCIREYNKTIRKEVARLNKQHKQERYFIVDTCQMLEDLAYKRNNGQPPYDFPKDLKFLYPPVNTKYYHADKEGALKQGGLFSLDGVHPTVIGHGIIAYEFLKKMAAAGVTDKNGKPIDADLPWLGDKGIIKSDLLYSNPIRIMQEIYGKDALASVALRIVDFIQNFAKK
jgi:hypothetical protein